MTISSQSLCSRISRRREIPHNCHGELSQNSKEEPPGVAAISTQVDPPGDILLQQLPSVSIHPSHRSSSSTNSSTISTLYSSNSTQSKSRMMHPSTISSTVILFTIISISITNLIGNFPFFNEIRLKEIN